MKNKQKIIILIIVTFLILILSFNKIRAYVEWRLFLNEYISAESLNLEKKKSFNYIEKIAVENEIRKNNKVALGIYNYVNMGFSDENYWKNLSVKEKEILIINLTKLINYNTKKYNNDKFYNSYSNLLKNENLEVVLSDLKHDYSLAIGICVQYPHVLLEDALNKDNTNTILKDIINFCGLQNTKFNGIYLIK